MIMSKELINALDNSDNVGAEKIFKDVMVQKVGDTLEIARQEVAKTFVQQYRDEKEAETNAG